MRARPVSRRVYVARMNGAARGELSDPDREWAGQASYLQCVECAALYAVEPEELDGAPRVVQCSACLHEWFAEDNDLLWGEREAAAALDAANAGSRKGAEKMEKQQAKRKAFVAAKGWAGAESQLDGQSGPLATAQRASNAAAGTPCAGGSGSEDINGESTDEELQYDSFSDLQRASPLRSNGRQQPNYVASRSVRDGSRDASTEDTATIGPASVRSSSDSGTTKAQNGVESGTEANFNVFVGNLSFRASEEDLYRAFSGYGAVLKCQIPLDPQGASRGYGFVEMADREAGVRAMEELQGASILGRDVALNEARPRRKEQAAPMRVQNNGRRSLNAVQGRTSGDRWNGEGSRDSRSFNAKMNSGQGYKSSSRSRSGKLRTSSGDGTRSGSGTSWTQRAPRNEQSSPRSKHQDQQG